MLEYIKSLQFEQAPDYPRLRNYLDDISKQYKFSLKENTFDWVVKLLKLDAEQIYDKHSNMFVRYKLKP